MNIATAVPQAIGPLIGAAAVVATGSFVPRLRARRRVRLRRRARRRAGAERALMALDLRLDVAMPDAGVGCRDLARSRRATGRPSPRPPGTSTRRSAPCTSARCAHNAHDMVRRAAARRSASRRSRVRVRGVIEALLALPGYHGVLAYTLAEALWLADTVDDIVVGLSRRRSAAASAGSRTDPELASRVTLMVDSPQQLDLIDAVLPPGRREEHPRLPRARRLVERPVLGHLGVRRSPVHDPADAGALAAYIVRRPGFRLVGMMALRGADRRRREPPSGPPGRRRREPLDAVALDARARRAPRRAPSRRCASTPTSSSSTAAARARSRSPRRTPRSPRSRRAPACSAATCSTATSTSRPAPAAAFALDVVRSPSRDHVDDPRRRLDRLGPARRRPAAAHRLARGTRDARLARSAGEVQTPVTGRAARDLRAGDRVWFRHTKSGELSRAPERVRRGRRRRGGRHRAHLPRRGEGVPVTASGDTWRNWGRTEAVRPVRVERPATAGAVQRAVERRRGIRPARQARRRRSQLHRHRGRARRAARPDRPLGRASTRMSRPAG